MHRGSNQCESFGWKQGSSKNLLVIGKCIIRWTNAISQFMQTETNHAFRSMDEKALREFFDEYRWIHLVLGLLGNLLFFGGSVLFLFDGLLQTAGIWGFVAGSFLMLVGSSGEALVKYAQSGS
jgi:hypothetical protein